MKVKAGSTNVSVYYYIVQDASNTSPGEPVTGLLFSDIETGGAATYVRQGAASADLTLITLANSGSAHSDGGFILVDDTKNPGLYRCDYPDAAFATGIDQVFLQIVVASANNAIAAPILVDIDDNVDQTADHTAGIADIPTVSEFNARTLIAASYFDPAADLVANVMLVATTTANTDMRGTNNALLAADINLTAGAVDNVTTTTNVTSDVGITQASADKVWLSSSRTLTDGFVKNQPFSDLEFLMVLASDHVTPATGLTVTGQRSIDGGAFSAISGAIAEVSNGIYQVDLLAADTSGDSITYRFSSGTADDTFISVITHT